jgi:hypothetical protein
MERALEADPRGDWLRMLGGVLLAVGAAILFWRKADEWAKFPLLLLVGIPCALVFTLGTLAALATKAVGRWHAVLMVTGVLLSVVAFGQLWDTVGIPTEDSGFSFLWFACVAALAAFGSFYVGAAYHAFLAAVAGILAWLFFWNMILDEPGTATFRWLLIVLLIAYVAAALRLRRADAPQASELVTAAGLTGVVVGTIGIFDGAQGALGLLFGAAPGGGEGQGFVWDLFLLAFSLALVAYGAAAHARGPAYVGFFGLLAFVAIQGAEVNALLGGEEPDSSFAGWPLVLVLIGGGALAAGMLVRSGPPPPPEPETYEVRT